MVVNSTELMKYFLFILFSLSCLAQNGSIRIAKLGIIGGSPGTGGGGGCSTLAETVNSGTTVSAVNSATDSASQYIASPFTAAGTETICSATLIGYEVGTTWSFTHQIAIYTDDTSGSPAHRPGTLVGTASATRSRQGSPLTENNIVFTGMSANLTAGTIYWAVVISSGNSGGDTGQVLKLTYASISYPGYPVLENGGPGAWVGIDNGDALKITFNK